MTAKITHAKAPMPDHEVIDMNSGTLVEDVIEVDTDYGWLIRTKRDPNPWTYGVGPASGQETVKGRFRVRRKGSL